MKRHLLWVIFLSITLSTPNLKATGALFVKDLRATDYQVAAIKTYDAKTTIEDQVATTYIDETFFNHLNTTAEATCIFPLPEGAVITELIYWMNGVKYIASVKEKKAAQQAYNDKIRRMLDPALLQFAGDNVFKLNIAPLNPRTDVRFAITYTELLPYEFGKVSYKFLLNATSISSKPLERVSLTINAHTQSKFISMTSPTHGNFTVHKIQQNSPSDYTMTFGDENFLPDRDYVLSFETARDGVDIHALGYVGAPQDSLGDGFFATWITPPDNLNEQYATPRNIVFVADISSSMEGRRITQLKEALGVFLDALMPYDRFNIVVFSTNVVSMKSDLVQATPQATSDARNFVQKLGAVGLTDIDDALKASLSMSFSDSTANSIVFMTDGMPSWGEMDSSKILANVKRGNTKNIRIFSFGIGEDLNKYLLTNLASQNAGYTAYINSADSIPVVIANHFKKISLPALQAPSIDYGSLQTYDVYPIVLPDLFFGAQVLQLGRYKSGGVYPVTLKGKIRGNDITQTSNVNFPSTVGGNKSVSRLWAQLKINELLGQIDRFGERKELVDAIIQLSIKFGILTRYTALYADPDDKATPVVEEGTAMENATLAMSAAMPNPFSSLCAFTLRIKPTTGMQHVRIAVYDVMGNLITYLADDAFDTGEYRFEWNGTKESGEAASAGIYLLRVECGNNILTQKIVLMR